MNEDDKQQSREHKVEKIKKPRQLFWALGTLLLWVVVYLAIHFHFIKS